MGIFQLRYSLMALFHDALCVVQNTRRYSGPQATLNTGYEQSELA